MKEAPKRILHITNWYPSPENSLEAIFIARHIGALAPHCENTIWRLAVEGGKPRKKQLFTDEQGVTHYITHYKTSRWLFLELFAFWMLFKLLFFKVRRKDYDLINFHIAYPNCTYLHWLRPFLKQPIVISEHWSAYQRSFGITNPKKSKRIRRIFKYKIPVLTVSKALGNDIRNFADQAAFDNHIVPNIVDSERFGFSENISKSPDTFFMVAKWQSPKKPLVVIEAFANILNQQPQAKLRIGGYGKLEPDILEAIKSKNLQSNISYLGKLKPSQVAEEMQKAEAYMHCSDYETFSVVCAESITCGTPVLASPVGGIVEFINDENGLFAKENTVEAWTKVLEEYFEKKNAFDSKLIAQKAFERFNTKQVGITYYNTLTKIYQEAKH